MPVLRRLAAIVFTAALLSLPSVSPALATTVAPLPNLSSPSVTRVSSGDTYVFARGTDNSLLLNRRVNGNWTGSRSFGGVIVDSPSSVAVGNSAWAFVHGTDDNVYFSRFTNGLSSGYEVLPGLKVSGRVTAISGFDTEVGQFVQIFARDQNGIGFANRFVGGAWSGWEKIAGDRVLTSDITPVAGGGNISLFARGADNAGYFATSQGSLSGFQFSGFFSLGGGLTSNIAAYQGSRSLFLTARGYDNALYVNILNENGFFSGWIGLGGGITSDLSITGTGDDNPTILARGNDLALYAITVDRFGGTNGYIGLGGGFLGNPVAVPLPPERAKTGIEVFGRGFDNGLYTIKRVNGAWSGFVGLGGQLG